MDSTKITAGKAHRHAAMIKAKADNMELVVFVKYNEEWQICNSVEDGSCCFYSDCDYFLCLEHLKNECNHWLNGGHVSISFGGQEMSWSNENLIWSLDCPFMSRDFNIKIKPRKEKRWIAVNSFGDVMPVHCKDLESAKQLVQYKDVGINGEVQYIEIEVEV